MRFTMTQEQAIQSLLSWAPDAQLLEFPGLKVYTFEQRGKHLLQAFNGKSAKPQYLAFRNAESRAQWIENASGAAAAVIAYKSERKAARASFVHTLKVGDVLRTVWGYDQTNIEYFEVTALVGKGMVEARELKQQRIETQFMQGKCVPVPGEYLAEAKRYKVLPGNQIRIYSFACASPCEFTEVAGAKLYSADRWTAYA